MSTALSLQTFENLATSGKPSIPTSTEQADTGKRRKRKGESNGIPTAAPAVFRAELLTGEQRRFLAQFDLKTPAHDWPNWLVEHAAMVQIINKDFDRMEAEQEAEQLESQWEDSQSPDWFELS